MATNSAGERAQKYYTNQVHYLMVDIAYTDDGTELSLGRLPSGAVIIPAASGVVVSEAFDAGTSSVLDVGTNGGDSDDPDLYGTDIDISSLGFTALDETGIDWTVSDDTEVTCTVTLSGTTATAGAGKVVVAYVV